MSEEEKPLTSYIIPTYNGEETIEETLDSIKNQNYPNKEIIVVNDNSNDSTRKIIEEKFPEIQLISLHKNKGHSFASNVGIETANGKYIGLMDDDIEISEDWTNNLISVFQSSSEEVAILQPTIRENERDREREGYVQDLQACGVLARRDCLIDVGGYEDKYFVYYNDHQLAAKLLKNGYKIKATDKAVTRHKNGKTPGFDNEFAVHYEVRNKMWYIWENYGWINVAVGTIHWPIKSGIKAIKDGYTKAWLKSLLTTYKGINYLSSDHRKCKELEHRMW